MKQPASTPAASGGITEAVDTSPIRMLLGNYANVYVTSHGHWAYVHVWTLLSESRMD